MTRSYPYPWPVKFPIPRSWKWVGRGHNFNTQGCVKLFANLFWLERQSSRKLAWLFLLSVDSDVHNHCRFIMKNYWYRVCLVGTLFFIVEVWFLFGRFRCIFSGYFEINVPWYFIRRSLWKSRICLYQNAGRNVWTLFTISKYIFSCLPNSPIFSAMISWI